jgi:hypothetical protein
MPDNVPTRKPGNRRIDHGLQPGSESFGKSYDWLHSSSTVVSHHNACVVVPMS